ncbi:MAG: hypothetical protein OEL83_01290 [Desulforhopalus sp.]|nr:hypothetical protein [Desulforhopalus sp.]
MIATPLQKTLPCLQKKAAHGATLWGFDAPRKLLLNKQEMNYYGIKTFAQWMQKELAKVRVTRKLRELFALIIILIIS